MVDGCYPAAAWEGRGGNAAQLVSSRRGAHMQGMLQEASEHVLAHWSILSSSCMLRLVSPTSREPLTMCLVLSGRRRPMACGSYVKGSLSVGGGGRGSISRIAQWLVGWAWRARDQDLLMDEEYATGFITRLLLDPCLCGRGDVEHL